MLISDTLLFGRLRRRNKRHDPMMLTAAIAGEPGNPLVDYVGATSGGIWKTENRGVDWKPVFDQQNMSAIGALAVSQSQPNVVWAGTGETFIIRPFIP